MLVADDFLGMMGLSDKAKLIMTTRSPVLIKWAAPPFMMMFPVPAGPWRAYVSRRFPDVTDATRTFSPGHKSTAAIKSAGISILLHIEHRHG